MSQLGDSTRYSQEDRGDTWSPERVWLDGELSQSCGHVRPDGNRALWSLFWGELGATGRGQGISTTGMCSDFDIMKTTVIEARIEETGCREQLRRHGNNPKRK